MKKITDCRFQPPPSPWLQKDASSLIHYEAELANKNSSLPAFIPHELFVWILKNKGQEHLFRSLDRLAPLFPVIAYHGHVALWTSPPPSGQGNVVGIIMGRDKTNTLRFVGSNYLTEPERSSHRSPTANEFFEEYDRGGRLARERLVYDTICASISTTHVGEQDFWSRVCRAFMTMPVYLVALTNEKNLLGIGPAAVEGVKPADFSYELLGEIK